MGQDYEWRRIGRPTFMQPPFDGQPVELRLASGTIVAARINDPELVVTEDGDFTRDNTAWVRTDGSRLPEGDAPEAWRPADA
jgi:hypothetical protein